MGDLDALMETRSPRRRDFLSSGLGLCGTFSLNQLSAQTEPRSPKRYTIQPGDEEWEYYEWATREPDPKKIYWPMVMLTGSRENPNPLASSARRLKG